MARLDFQTPAASRHWPWLVGLGAGLPVLLAAALGAPAWLLPLVGGLGGAGIAWVLTAAPGEGAASDTPIVTAPASRDDDFAILESLSDPVLVVDPKLVILGANAAARALFGTDPVGDSVTLFLRQPAVSDLVTMARVEGLAGSTEIQLHYPVERTYLMHAAALPTRADHLVVSLQDVTQTRLAERMRVDFVANASHELRTPLATLIGFIETLQGPAATDTAARDRFLAIMEREAGRMARLIDDLLSLSRIELDKHKRPTQLLDLKPLLGDVGNTLGMRLDKDERRIQISVAADLPPVLADRDQMLQVIHNLMSNALKYGRSGTPIEVGARVEPADALVRVWVTDQGEGVPAAHLPRLTERFYRVDTARSRILGGTGLGLAIVKHIVERHGGKLAIDSQIGKGTTVSFTLPLPTAQNPAMPPLPAPDPGLSQN